MQAPQTTIRISDDQREFLVANVPCAMDKRSTKGVSTRIITLIDETISERLASEIVEREFGRIELLGHKPSFEDLGGDYESG